MNIYNYIFHCPSLCPCLCKIIYSPHLILALHRETVHSTNNNHIRGWLSRSAFTIPSQQTWQCPVQDDPQNYFSLKKEKQKGADSENSLTMLEILRLPDCWQKNYPQKMKSSCGPGPGAATRLSEKDPPQPDRHSLHQSQGWTWSPRRCKKCYRAEPLSHIYRLSDWKSGVKLNK